MIVKEKVGTLSYTNNVYSASGMKLKTNHYTHPEMIHEELNPTDPDPADPLKAAVTANPGDSLMVHPGELMLGLERFEYRGPVIYRNGKVHMVQFPGGYATIKDGAVTFHYYTQDYLGNNRAVINGSTGAIEQTTAYYPCGGVIADLGTGNSGQPFKFGGKELINNDMIELKKWCGSCNIIKKSRKNQSKLAQNNYYC